MRIFADLHIHSKYARATSQEMDLENLSRFGKVKGLNLIGIGDFTHPLQLKDLKEKLIPIEGSGLYEYNGMKFMLTTEMATFYFQDKKPRKVHHVVHAPDFEIVDQMIDVLEKKGANTGIDGRMAVKISSPEFVEILLEISKEIEIVPAHAWTPFFGIFGSETGFNFIKECYQDMTKNIHAIETGMSSDPAMNWRISWLDDFCMMSNSDSHSPWSWRLGRECNVFDLKKISYFELFDAVKKKDKKRFLFTLETDPAYGKYHWTGHRICKVSMSAQDSLKVKNICPKCRKPMTVGVEQRIEELADRPVGYVLDSGIPFKRLIPLAEILKLFYNAQSISCKKIEAEYSKLVGKFGSEFEVLLYAPSEEIEKVTDKSIARLIMLNRTSGIKIKPGYDGVYGEPILQEIPNVETKKSQKSLMDFKGL